jgi:hypothetical protein
MTAEALGARSRVPRDEDNDYTRDMAAERRAFIRDQTGANLSHVAQFSPRTRGMNVTTVNSP